MNQALKRDYAKTDVSAVSELGLIEMTRQRTRKSLESVVYQACSYCHGKGLVKSPATMAIFALRKISKMLQKGRRRTLLVFAHPDVTFCLVNQNKQSTHFLERKFRTRILIKADPKLHMEELKIESA